MPKSEYRKKLEARSPKLKAPVSRSAREATLQGDFLAASLRHLFRISGLPSDFDLRSSDFCAAASLP